MDIPILQAENLKQYSSLRHCFTTRLGGTSREPRFSSLNLGVKTEDTRSCIHANFDAIRERMGFTDIVLANQEHTDTVRVVNRSDAGRGLTIPLFPEGVDALVTNTPNLALGVVYADCVPVLLYDPVKSAIGAVHSGWRGTVARIAVKAAQMLCHTYGSRPETIVAAIGPSIRQCHFETGLEVAQEFKAAYGGFFSEITQIRGDKAYIDMQSAVAHDLREYGLRDVGDLALCTVCRNDTFFSHRCGDGGRMCALIEMISEERK